MHVQTSQVPRGSRGLAVEAIIAATTSTPLVLNTVAHHRDPSCLVVVVCIRSTNRSSETSHDVSSNDQSIQTTSAFPSYHLGGRSRKDDMKAKRS